jgi:itaconate CoA-transferase
MTLPLSGIRVVALEQAVAAPMCSRHLADMGADVVKVERTDGGDLARRYDSVVQGLSAYFVWLNRGKRSICLDVKQAGGMDVLRKLLEEADVFVHNLGPGAVERLGLGYDALHATHPRLIWCSISGYGPDGPYRDRKAFDLLLQAESGVMALTGSPDEPAKVGISIADITAGVYAFSSILLALIERGRSGEGRRIDVSLLDSLAEWMTAPLYHYLYGGVELPRGGMRHNMIVPYGPYRCGGDARVFLACRTSASGRRCAARCCGGPSWSRTRASPPTSAAWRTAGCWSR